MPKSDFKFFHRMRVRWKECDVQGIVYYGSYLDFIDVAQAEYYRNLGILPYTEEYRKTFDLAAVKVTLEYKGSAKMDDLIDVYIAVRRIGRTSIVKQSEIYRSSTKDLLVTGETISVNFDSSVGQSRPIPTKIRNIIEKFEKTGATPTWGRTENKPCHQENEN